MNKVKFSKGQIVIKFNELNDYFYLIQEGTIEVFINLSHRPKKYLPFVELKSQDFLGEISFLDKRPSPFTAIAKTDCTMVKFSRDDVNNKDDIFSQQTLDRILKSLCARIRDQITV